MRLWLVGLIPLALVVAGCADTHHLVRSTGAGQTATLERGGSAYVAVSSDGRYGNTVYSGSAAMASQAVASAFGTYLRSVTVSAKSEEFEQALQSARAGDFTYLIYPQILHWEDRATEWSGRPDVASVKLSIVAAKSAQVVDSVVINGKSGLATFGGDHPQDLLPKPMADYAASMFR